MIIIVFILVGMFLDVDQCLDMYACHGAMQGDVLQIGVHRSSSTWRSVRLQPSRYKE